MQSNKSLGLLPSLDGLRPIIDRWHDRAKSNSGSNLNGKHITASLGHDRVSIVRLLQSE